MTDYLLNGLVKRRADLAGEMHTLQGKVNQLHIELAALDVVIRQFAPDYKLESIRPRYRRQASPVETATISRATLDVLRRAEGTPMGAKAIAAQVMKDRALDPQDTALVRSMTKRVDMALRYQRTNRTVEASEVEGGGWFGVSLNQFFVI